jgi:HEPN domain-containing protein
MASRVENWYKQARRDLQHARHALEDEEFEWACFAAQQSAEKALKALYQAAGEEAGGIRYLPCGKTFLRSSPPMTR